MAMTFSLNVTVIIQDRSIYTLKIPANLKKKISKELSDIRKAGDIKKIRKKINIMIISLKDYYF